MMNFLPISIAPCDGTWFHAFDSDGVWRCVQFQTQTGPFHMRSQILVDEGGRSVEAAYWQPLTA